MQDRYGHRISYLRVSITDRCNERCTYCMPHELQEWLPREDILTYEETLRLIRIAAGWVCRKSGSQVASRSLAAGSSISFANFRKFRGFDDIGLSTNGTLLAREVEPGTTMARALRNAGVRSVNISLDTLDREFTHANHRT